MRRATIFGVGALCAALAIACAGKGNRPQPADIRGCLTASGDQFVLTQLQDASTAAKPTTDVFQLTKTANHEVDLQQYVGKIVRVTGEADPPRVADVREGDTATPAGTTGREAKVGTVEDTRIAYRRLTVSSVTPTGDACPAPTTAPPRPPQ